MSLYKDQLNEFVSSLDLKGKVLIDWGGSQNPIKGRTNTWEIEDYKIVDLEVPHSSSPEPDLVQDANEPLKGDILKYVNKTDILIAFGIYDYVINPNIATNSISKLLSSTGYAWIEWPLFYGHHEPLWDEGCRYSEGCIMRLLGQSKLKLDEMIRKPAGNPLLVQFMRMDGQRLSKNYEHHDTVGFITKVSHGT